MLHLKGDADAGCNDQVIRGGYLGGDRDGTAVAPVCRFLQHILDSGGSPNTASAYGFDLKNLFEFLDETGTNFQDFRPAIALNFLGWLRKRPSRRPAQRLGLAVTGAEGRLLAAATAARVLAAVSSFYEWAVVAELFDAEKPMRRQPDPALARVAERHRPFPGESIPRGPGPPARTGSATHSAPSSPKEERGSRPS